jgi:hypothetical protein
MSRVGISIFDILIHNYFTELLFAEGAGFVYFAKRGEAISAEAHVFAWDEDAGGWLFFADYAFDV